MRLRTALRYVTLYCITFHCTALYCTVPHRPSEELALLTVSLFYSHSFLPSYFRAVLYQLAAQWSQRAGQLSFLTLFLSSFVHHLIAPIVHSPVLFSPRYHALYHPILFCPVLSCPVLSCPTSHLLDFCIFLSVLLYFVQKFTIITHEKL
jgi:hypothetical protein